MRPIRVPLARATRTPLRLGRRGRRRCPGFEPDTRPACAARLRPQPQSPRLASNVSRVSISQASCGAISVRFSDEPEGVLETSGGGIEVEFHQEAGASLDAKTSGGRVEVEHGILVRGDLDPDHVVGDINGGGRALLLRTSGGDIRIRER